MILGIVWGQVFYFGVFANWTAQELKTNKNTKIKDLTPDNQ
jgi:hypothetical protein